MTTRHLATLRELAKLDPTVIVPGHGPAFRDRGYLDLEAELLQTVVDGVHAELAKGVLALADVQKAVTAETLRERFTHNDPDLDTRFRARVKAFVKFAVAEARDGVELPQ
jgi:glyoxylase-like metal-dependent hydrolase (beta-lactamase superfamily II)